MRWLIITQKLVFQIYLLSLQRCIQWLQETITLPSINGSNCQWRQNSQDSSHIDAGKIKLRNPGIVSIFLGNNFHLLFVGWKPNQIKKQKITTTKPFNLPSNVQSHTFRTDSTIFFRFNIKTKNLTDDNNDCQNGDRAAVVLAKSIFIYLNAYTPMGASRPKMLNNGMKVNHGLKMVLFTDVGSKPMPAKHIFCMYKNLRKDGWRGRASGALGILNIFDIISKNFTEFPAEVVLCIYMHICMLYISLLLKYNISNNNNKQWRYLDNCRPRIFYIDDYFLVQLFQVIIYFLNYIPW